MGWRQSARAGNLCVFDGAGADETVIGHEPPGHQLDGSGVTVETFRARHRRRAGAKTARASEYFEQFGDKLPHELREELKRWKSVCR
ncbi:MAG: hypothetical protein ACLTG4_01610 [Oscillospiraceae bacterium]